MNIRKLTSIMLSLMMALTTFAACDTAETIPDGSVPITPEESAMISEMLEEGMDEEEIAEVLSTMETTEATGETNGNTDVTEPSVVESVAPNGETVRVTPTTAPRQTVTQTIRNADGSTSTIRVTATATPRPTGTATTAPTSTTTTTAPASTTTTTAPTSAPSGTFKTSVEDEIVDLINNLRKATAVADKVAYYVPIQMTSSVRSMAQTRAKELVANFNHVSASGTNLADECIYKGSASSASAIFGAWKGSGAHKASMCAGCESKTKSAKYCGIGVWFYNGIAYAVFGTKGSASGTGLPSGYTAPEQTTPTTAPTSTTTTATPTETTAPTTTTTTAAPTETTVVTTEATTQVQNSTVDDTGDSGGDG
ncbi:Uncharacterized conserved protein YkwD, contains CAP (CSP/antigen 5/PR1) domain [Ruminococcaceae bacterium YRB3002]|nr:Uncharacterized conserved protein YkwD, contains CAP (CSP/antigen 5/PR1) domain [Ruminococcaceae bacterium YRB3002]